VKLTPRSPGEPHFTPAIIASWRATELASQWRITGALLRRFCIAGAALLRQKIGEFGTIQASPEARRNGAPVR